MYKINETKLDGITKNTEAIRDNFGKWVQLYIKTDSEVIVTSSRKKLFTKKNNIQVLGALSKEHSKNISNKIYAGKKIKARICDFCPAFMTSNDSGSRVKISIWEN